MTVSGTLDLYPYDAQYVDAGAADYAQEQVGKLIGAYTDFGFGFADTVTLGATMSARNALRIADAVDYSSLSYAHGTAFGLLGGVAGAIEFAGWAAATGPAFVIDGPGRGTRLFQIRDADSGQPIFRLDYGPVPSQNGDMLHYHRAPDLRLHRPFEGGW